jgi:hypothetical protein
MDGGLLVHDLDRPDLVAPIEERIRDRPATVTGDASSDRYATADEVLDDDLGAGEGSRSYVSHVPKGLPVPGFEVEMATG